MSKFAQETAVVIAVVAAACAIPGTFLVLRRLVMLADAISHVLLFGIVTMYLLVRDLHSPLLLIGAAASGLLTVVLVEALQRTRLVKADAAIGLVFPAVFSLGTIIASMYLRNTHLDADQVLLGSAELAPSDRLVIGDHDLGPRSVVILGGCLVVMLGLLVTFYKELKLATFDPEMAAVMGLAPAIIHYALMTTVSLTTVAAFDAVGPVLVLALFAVPPMTARLFTDRLGRMMVGSVIVAVGGGVLGTIIAFRVDTNVAGTVAATLGGVFGLAYLFAPRHGLLAQEVRRHRQRRTFEETILTVHLQRHEGTPVEAEENARAGVHRHLNWTPHAAAAVIDRATRRGWVTANGQVLTLTATGRRRVAEVLRL